MIEANETIVSEEDLRPNLAVFFWGCGAVALISAITLPWPVAIASTALGALMVAGADVNSRTYLLPDIITWGGIVSGSRCADARPVRTMAEHGNGNITSHGNCTRTRSASLVL